MVCSELRQVMARAGDKVAQGSLPASFGGSRLRNQMFNRARRPVNSQARAPTLHFLNRRDLPG